MRDQQLTTVLRIGLFFWCSDGQTFQRGQYQWAI